MKSKGKGDTREPHDTLHDEQPPFDLHRTLPTGAAFKSTWKLPALRPSGSPPAQPGHDASNVSGVRPVPEATSPTHSSELSRGQTLISMVPGAVMPSEQPGPPAQASLGKTMRMELGVSTPSQPAPRHSVFQQNEPRDTLEPEAPTEAQSATRRAAFSRSQETVHAASVQRVGDALRNDYESTRSSSTRPTDPFGHPAQRDAVTSPSPVPEQPENKAAADTRDGRTRIVTPRLPNFAGHAGAQAEAPTAAAPEPEDTAGAARASSRPSWRPSSRPSTRPQRAATARGGMSTRAWAGAALCVGALFAALAVLYIATEPTDEEALPSSARPNVVTPAPLSPAGHPSPAATNVTELSSIPIDAEIVLNGAVVANTPARLARGNYEADYLVRLPGYDSQLIRIGPKSPAQITVRLLPLVVEPTK